jgi:KDO2-lipid IV(A) lauroyltransferase
MVLWKGEMIKFFLFFCSILPLRLNHFLGASIGRLLHRFGSDAKRVTIQNIDLCFPELPQKERNSLVKKSLIETGKGLSESGWVWNKNFKDNAKYIRRFVGKEHLDGAEKTILLTPHMGCWEITGRVIACERALTFLYKPLSKSAQNNYLFERRNQGNLTMASADKLGVLKLQRTMAKGQLIGILPDQDPGAEGGIMAPFFNHPVNTMTLLAKLAKKNNAKVVMLWAKRLDKGQGFDLIAEPIDILTGADDVLGHVSKMNSAIEALVRQCPEQYLWSYRRFKSSHCYDE